MTKQNPTQALSLTSLGGVVLLTAAMTVGALPLAAGPLINNGSFTTGASASFSINDPTVLAGWAEAPTGTKVLNCLVFNASSTNMCGTTNGVSNNLALWHNPGASPDGGNYVMIDGDSTYGGPLTQVVAGLIAGHLYTLSFYQAAGQQNGFNSGTGPISVNWNVSFGNDLKIGSSMTFAQGSAANSYAPWSLARAWFNATSTTQTLSFMAVGPSGAPPFLMLDGVSLLDTTGQPTPEPATMALIGIGLIIPLVHRILKARKAKQV